MFNSTEQMWIGVIVFIYFIFLIGLSFVINRKIKTYDDYNVAGRTVSTWPLILTFVGTGVGGATLLGYMENGYSLGMGQQWIHITMLFAIILLASFMLKRIREIGEKHQMVTIGDYAALRYGEKARLPTVISFLFSYCAMTGMQFVAIATILNLTLGMNMTTGILVGWAILTVKTYLGGLKAVVWQDVIQGTMLTVGVIILFFIVWQAAGSWENVSQTAHAQNEGAMLSVFNISSNEIMIYLLTLAFYQFIRQDVWQRIWAANSLRTARNGYWVSMLIAVGLGALIVGIGVFSRFGLNIQSENPALIYYDTILHVLPTYGVILMVIVLLAAVISSADSFFIAGSSSIANDIIKPLVKAENEKNMVLYSRISVLVVSVISLVLALKIPGLVNLMVTGTAMSVSALLAPIVLGMFWKRPNQTAGVWGMWAGLSLSVLWQILGHPFGVHPIMVGLPFSFVVLMLITVLSKQEIEAKVKVTS